MSDWKYIKTNRKTCFVTPIFTPKNDILSDHCYTDDVENIKELFHVV